MPDDDQAQDRPSVDTLSYVWDEYKYRHALCWSAVYKIAAAVLTLQVLPYVRDDLTKILKYWMLIPPVLGIALAAFGIAVVRNELALFAKIKTVYRDMQNRFFRRRIHELREPRHFDKYVCILMFSMLILAALNLAFLALCWIPLLTGAGRHDLPAVG